MRSTQDILWLGAHKTGTTYLQDILARSRPALAHGGLLYVGLQAFRGRYTKPVLSPDLAGPKAAPPLRPISGSAGRHLIFDENILSLVQDALAPQGLYPEGEERALRIAQAVGLAKPVLVLGIRNYAGFLPSLYCETLKAQPFQTFEAFQKTGFSALSWCDLAERLLAAFPGARLKVYRAEALRNREAELLSWVCETVRPDHWMRVQDGVSRREGFSHDAMMALHDLAAARGPESVTAQDLTNALSTHPREGGQAYSPWTPEEKEALTLRYRADIAAIKALPRVDMWSLPA
ncbi:hypothetical protein [Donghicola sp. XS_ASV15]|uniref:hypothetical protein n=1 Tax=Donghicola sp. XS_ASV15 TaxID=3241295 RepID=UPI0035175952